MDKYKLENYKMNIDEKWMENYGFNMSIHVIIDEIMNK